MNPLLQNLRRLELRTKKTVTGLFAGNYKSAFKGQGMEMADIREYAPGDQVRDIDWKTSARKGHLYVKQYEESRNLSVMFVADLSGSLFYGTGDRTKFDVLLETIALLGYSAVSSGDKVGLLSYQESVETYFSPQRGRGAFWRMLLQLSQKRNDLVYRQSCLVSALQHLHRASRERMVVFLLTDEIAPDPLLHKWLTITHKRHDLVVLSLSHTSESTFPDRGLFHLEDPETGERGLFDFSQRGVRKHFSDLLAQKESQENAFFRTSGIDRLSLSEQSSLFESLFVFFQKRQRRY